ncbi:baseplate tail tube cap [Pectobacterium bacteriophage PM2]|uniref:Baseplate tail tube cap n=1 Tax=Pectobacterium bacteriophage PM2 TaxID=1429794 RepID=A0A0A0Q3K6_9CAUD|nr:baseplate tail tube cap [Pectobacterium bacteriophage PM2]AHY25177.1 baseplate tail tube cap [Pectobacterium bacteriophage PM2]
MNFRELTGEDVWNIWKGGEKTSAGQSKQKTAQKTISAQYPAERAAGNDSTNDFRVTDLYKNGLLFTAYDYSSRTTPDMRSLRERYQKGVNSGVFNALSSLVKGEQKPENFNSAPVANILLPRSKSDVDSVSHKFNDVGESLITRGGGTATGILSNIASTSVFGAIESLTNGVMADHGEQMYNTARSMYAGPDNRTKVFTWEMTPRNVQDLIQIIKIYEIFNYYSYGETGNSAFAADLKSQIDEWYKGTFFKKEAIDSYNGTLTGEQITNFLSNVIVVSNPTIWFIRNFGTTSSFDGKTDIFGPCQIQSIRFDKTPDGHFNGLSVAPNMPSTFVLEITFREILTLNRANLYMGGIS